MVAERNRYDSRHDHGRLKPTIVRENEDWLCTSCGNMNYYHREKCNMRKCGAPRPPRNWKCVDCGNINFPTRVRCNMRKCGAERPASSSIPDPSVAAELSENPGKPESQQPFVPPPVVNEGPAYDSENPPFHPSSEAPSLVPTHVSTTRSHG